MNVVNNSDGSTTVTCNGATVTINPPAPVAGGGSLSSPGTVIASIVARRQLGEASGLGALARLLAEAGPSGAAGSEQALVLHGGEAFDVDRVRRALDDAGLGHLAIEITPRAPHG